MRYFFILFFLVLSTCLKAQYPYLTVGPDDTLDCRTNCTTLHSDYFHARATNSYTVSQIPYSPFSFSSGINIGLSADDAFSSLIALPFHFCFMGSQYDYVVIGTNGVITFNQTYASTTCPWNLTGGETLPTDSFPTESIMAPMQDMNSTDEGSIYVDTIGTAPARAFVISYYGMPYYSCIDSFLTSQVVLYETTNVIDIYIQSKPVCSGWNGGRAIEGIQKDGSLGYTVPGRNNSQWSAANDAWRFSPSAPPNIARIAWYQGASVISSLDSVTVCPTTTTTYVAVVSYTPCSAGPPTVLHDTITIFASYLAVQQASSQNVTCFGNNDGYASVNVNGGSQPYTYLWTPGGLTTSTASGLTAGNYTVTVSDATTCYNTVNINITQPPLLTLSDSSVATTCSSCSDGIIILNAAGGTPSYLYSITPAVGNQIGGFFYNLPAGTYTACVVDMNGCDTCSTVVVDFASGLPSLLHSGQAVFLPNPFSKESKLSIDASGNQSYNLIITDVSGRDICVRTLDKEHSVITRTDIPRSGIYSYRLFSGKSFISSGKLVVAD
jgi:hypothetical protein